MWEDVKLLSLPLLSFFYRCGRRLFICVLQVKSWLAQKKFDFEDVINQGDRFLHGVDRFAGDWVHSFPLPRDCGVYVHDLFFPSPLVVSSFKDDPIILDIWLRMGMGGAITKTILEYPHLGNPRPRIIELPSKKAFLNAMGLPGLGIEGLERMLSCKPNMLQMKRPMGISIGGRDVGEYKRNVKAIERICQSFPSHVHFFLELNLSCPNIQGGQDICHHQEVLSDLLEYVCRQTQYVVGVKLSPDKNDDALLELVRTIAQFPRTYVNLGNTQHRYCSDLGLSEDAIAMKGGGLSGVPLYPRTLEMIRLVSEVNLPIMATGGVFTSEQVYQLQKAGASLIGIATALVKDPYAVVQINQSL